jgi:hypothetical protein
MSMAYRHQCESESVMAVIMYQRNQWRKRRNGESYQRENNNNENENKQWRNNNISESWRNGESGVALMAQ